MTDTQQHWHTVKPSVKYINTTIHCKLCPLPLSLGTQSTLSTTLLISSVPMSGLQKQKHTCMHAHTRPQECDVLHTDVPMYVMNAAYGVGSTENTGPHCNFCTKECCKGSPGVE